ncbi:hypothetical protein H4582DRAFT_2052652 [Lactarius indigo]|nr:hypothetical protein H4582DRAFT_2052652 [Lactarius indigo]
MTQLPLVRSWPIWVTSVRCQDGLQPFKLMGYWLKHRNTETSDGLQPPPAQLPSFPVLHPSGDRPKAPLQRRRVFTFAYPRAAEPAVMALAKQPLTSVSGFPTQLATAEPPGRRRSLVKGTLKLNPCPHSLELDLFNAEACRRTSSASVKQAKKQLTATNAIQHQQQAQASDDALRRWCIKKNLKVANARWEWGGNEHIHRKQPDGTSRLLAKASIWMEGTTENRVTAP